MGLAFGPDQQSARAGPRGGAGGGPRGRPGDGPREGAGGDDSASHGGAVTTRWSNGQVLSLASAFINDSGWSSTMWLQYPAPLIAAACVSLAFKASSVGLVDPPCWIQLLRDYSDTASEDADHFELRAILSALDPAQIRGARRLPCPALATPSPALAMPMPPPDALRAPRQPLSADRGGRWPLPTLCLQV